MLLRGVDQIKSVLLTKNKTDDLCFLLCDKCRTFTVSCYTIHKGMGGTRSKTRPVVQGGLCVRAGVTVVAVWPVAQSAVQVALQTPPLLFVLKEPLRTVQHAQALVEKVILLTACAKNTHKCRKDLLHA